MVAMDEFASAFGFDSKPNDTWTTLGKVTAVSGTTLTVKLGGSSSTTQCEAYCLAAVDDIVFVVITDGKARAVAVKGGEDLLLDGSYEIRRSYVDSTAANNNVSNNSYVYYKFGDSNGLFTGWVGNIALTDGMIQTQLAARKRINNANVDNVLYLDVDATGNRIVAMTDPAVWLTALGIGAIYEDTKSDLSTTANQDTYVQGAKITLPKGNYIIYTRWQFGSTSAAQCSTTVGVGGSSGIWSDSNSRIRQYDAWWTAHTTTYICTLSSQTDIYSYGSCSVARSSCSSFIRAIKVG